MVSADSNLTSLANEDALFVYIYDWSLRGFGLSLMSNQLRNQVLYVENDSNRLKYKVVDHKFVGDIRIIIEDYITTSDLPALKEHLTDSLELKKIRPLMPEILTITSKRGHTNLESLNPRKVQASVEACQKQLQRKIDSILVLRSPTHKGKNDTKVGYVAVDGESIFYEDRERFFGLLRGWYSSKSSIKIEGTDKDRAQLTVNANNDQTIDQFTLIRQQQIIISLQDQIKQLTDHLNTQNQKISLLENELQKQVNLNGTTEGSSVTHSDSFISSRK